MKNVKLNGYTTAEMLIKLSDAYDEIVSNAIMFAEFKGNWNESTVYKYGNIVRGTGDSISGKYGSFIYINNTAASGVNLGNSEYWFLIALDGAGGKNGNDGNSITSINTISHSTVGDETVTKLRVDIENTAPQEIEVHAQNGQSITDVVAGTPVEENGYTKTPISFFYNGSDVETVDVVAKNGVDGAAVYVHLSNVSGTLTDEQMGILTNPNNGIIFNNIKILRCVDMSNPLVYVACYESDNLTVMICTVNRATKQYSIISEDIQPKTLMYAHKLKLGFQQSYDVPISEVTVVLLSTSRDVYTHGKLAEIYGNKSGGIPIGISVNDDANSMFLFTRYYFPAGNLTKGSIELVKYTVSDRMCTVSALRVESVNDEVSLV